MKTFLPLVVVAVVLSACGGNQDASLEMMQSTLDSLKTEKADVTSTIIMLEKQINEMDTNSEKRITVVATQSFEPVRFEHFFEVQGSVETDQNAQIFPEAVGRITRISIKEGQRVSKGQALMSIDSRVLRNQIEEVKSRQQLAETVYRKQEKLWNQKIGSEIQFLEAKNNYESLKNNLDALNAQLDMYTVNAPFSGVVDEVFPKEGEMANPAMPAFRLLNLDEVYIKADVSESYLGKIHTGDSVEVTFPSINQKMWTTISRIGDFINPNNRTFKIRLQLTNQNSRLKPNLLGRINIRDYYADSTFVIPSSLILQNTAGDDFVVLAHKAEDGSFKVSQQIVNVGMSYNGKSHVKDGLTSGVMVVSKGARQVKTGEEVKVKN